MYIDEGTNKLFKNQSTDCDNFGTDEIDNNNQMIIITVYFNVEMIA